MSWSQIIGSIRLRKCSGVKGREVSLQRVQGVVRRQTRSTYISLTCHMTGITVQEGRFFCQERHQTVPLTP